MIITRTSTEAIFKSIKKNPITAIIGARQVGKTTLAKEILKSYKKPIYIDLEKPSHFEMLREPEIYFDQHKDSSIICLDEIQLKPDIYNILRSFVDENKTPKFLILGSASPVLLRQSSESLAGRISYFTLPPMQYIEISSIVKIIDYHLLGGFPRSITANDNEQSFDWLSNFVKTFLERDLQMFGYNIPPEVLNRLWIMLAHLNGQILNYANLSTAMGIDAKTVKKYIDILQNTFMIRLLQPFHINIKKRLIKAPKIYIKDTGILHSLLGIDDYKTLYNHPVYGNSWETLVIENIINRFNKWESFYYRTANGAEIDLVLRKANTVIAIEVKASLTPKVTKGFWTAIEDVKADHAFIIAPVKEPYPYKKHVLVTNLDDFLKKEF